MSFSRRNSAGRIALTSWLGLGAARAAEEIPDLLPPREALPPSFWDQQGGMLGAAGLAALALMALLLWWRRRSLPVAVVPPAQVARRALQALRARPEDFTLVSEVTRVLRQFLIAVLNLRPDELTTEELLDELDRNSTLEPEVQSALGSFFRACDARKFAPLPLPEPGGVVSRAVAFVDQIEAHRRARPIPSPFSPETTPAAPANP